MHGQLRTLAAAAGLVVAAAGRAQGQTTGLGAAGELVDPDNLRVCADPSNMPLSDESGQGFENKIADLLASKLGRKQVVYTWFPQVQGFVRNTLRANKCDVIIGYPQGDELVQNTNAYYRSSYVVIVKKGGPYDGVTTIEDPKLKEARIGIVEGTPPSANMAKAKLLHKAKVYPLMFDTRLRPSQSDVMINDLVKGDIDAAILWGPTEGYYAKLAKADLVIMPLISDKQGSRMSYRITMGVRPSDQNWKRQLNDFIRDNQPALNAILIDYGVPIFDEQDKAITK